VGDHASKRDEHASEGRPNREGEPPRPAAYPPLTLAVAESRARARREFLDDLALSDLS